ncbi:hypothetical protein OPV22_032591 [Ensete ventricosum]|uniref:Uncharacterized protein n=1 Tax=Ensete ventricosum TaxID=4639 RepID=A0AAV8PPV9_ENSVE|nr:hypothetical protein OPV22_032591 [Ensete ventricosum]
MRLTTLACALEQRGLAPRWRTCARLPARRFGAHVSRPRSRPYIKFTVSRVAGSANLRRSGAQPRIRDGDAAAAVAAIVRECSLPRSLLLSPLSSR